jgi:hypothetical protein
MLQAVAQVLAAAVDGLPAGQRAALSSGALVHLARQLNHCEHGLLTDGDDRLLHCCHALHAIVHEHPAAQVRTCLLLGAPLTIAMLAPKLCGSFGWLQTCTHSLRPVHRFFGNNPCEYVQS